MSKPIAWAAALALTVLFTTACQDENPIERSSSLTGLWTIEPSATQSLVLQWEQDGSDFRGEMYVKSFLGTDGPFPLHDARAEGGTVSWSVRPSEEFGSDSLYFRGSLDTPNVVRGRLTVCGELAVDDTTVVDSCVTVPVEAVRDASGF